MADSRTRSTPATLPVRKPNAPTPAAKRWLAATELLGRTARRRRADGGPRRPCGRTVAGSATNQG
eukprot:6142823-Pyramimonas_sp.AAC.1